MTEHPALTQSMPMPASHSVLDKMCCQLPLRTRPGAEHLSKLRTLMRATQLLKHWLSLRVLL